MFLAFTQGSAALHPGLVSVARFQRAAAFDLCEQFECLPVSKEIADHAADLRRAHRWKLPDALQAAIAKDQKLRLVTRNTRDFDEKAHAFVMIPYRL
jgi:predicted nucleic acid-binding protein